MKVNYFQTRYLLPEFLIIDQSNAVSNAFKVAEKLRELSKRSMIYPDKQHKLKKKSSNTLIKITYHMFYLLVIIFNDEFGVKRYDYG